MPARASLATEYHGAASTTTADFARETQLSTPIAVAARANGQFVVADAGNHRVRKFGPGPG